MSAWYSPWSKLVMPPLTPVAWWISHHIIILSYARAASSSLSKQPRLVGLPFLRNCASHRLVGKVWCTPLNLLVYVRPLPLPLTFWWRATLVS